MIRVMSLLLPFFEDEGLKPDRIIVFTPRSEAEKEIFIALTKRNNYSSNVVTSLSERITKVKSALENGDEDSTRKVMLLITDIPEFSLRNILRTTFCSLMIQTMPMLKSFRDCQGSVTSLSSGLRSIIMMPQEKSFMKRSMMHVRGQVSFRNMRSRIPY